MQRCRAVLIGLLVAVSVPRPVAAIPLFIHGFDTVNDDDTPSTSTTACGFSSGSADHDACGFEQVLGGGAVDGDIHVQTAIVQDETTGGDSTSQWALRVNLASGEQAYYEVCDTTDGSACDNSPFPLLASTVSWHGAAHLPSAPTGDRTFRAFVEEDGALGCGLVFNSDRTLELRYFGGTDPTAGTSLGNTTLTLTQFACVPACSVSADCGTGGVCTSGKCTTIAADATEPPAACTEATQATDCVSGDCSATRRYWGGVTLTQEVATPQVACTLRLDGRTVLTTTPQQYAGRVSLRIANIRGGGLGTESVALDYYEDAWILNSAINAGHGYVTRQVVTSNGSPTAWAKSSSPPCVSGDENAWTCVNDYGESPFTLALDNVNTITKLATEQFDTVTAIDPLPPGATIAGLQMLLIGEAGSTAGGTARKIQGASLLCDGTTCNSTAFTPEVSVQPVTTTRPLLWHLAALPPVAGASGWIRTQVNNAGLVFQAGPNCCGGRRTHIMEAVLFSFVHRAATPLPSFLVDRNGDGLVTAAGVGDSTAGGTVTVDCVGGENAGQGCTQPDYCDWDAAEEKDKPAGGCAGDDTRCTTCNGLRRAETNGGAGYFCDLGGDGVCGAGDFCCAVETGSADTCTAGFCTSNANIPCTVNADCGDTALGSCDDNAACVPSCPCAACVDAGDCASGESCTGGVCTCGASCPSARNTWVAFLQDYVSPLDVLLQCEQGGETMTQMVSNRAPFILAGTGGCSTALVGTKHCTCDDDTDCGTNGDCSLAGICSTSDTIEDQCTQNSDCDQTPDAETCVFPKPDYVYVLEAYNDGLGSATVPLPDVHNPNCDRGIMHRNLGAIIPSDTFPCGVPTSPGPTLCSNDADCTGIHVDARCLGFVQAATPNQYCVQFPLPCTVTNTACRPGDACPLAGAVCDDTTGPSCDLSGLCACDADAECNTVSVCARDASVIVGPTCHRRCTSDASCGGLSGSCDTTCGGGTCPGGVTGYCRGYCTVPSAALSCTTDAQCARTTVAHRDGYTITYRGTCVAGQCECTGPSSLETTTECVTQMTRDFYGGLGHTRALNALHDLQGQIDALPDGTEPLLIVITPPRFNDASDIYTCSEQTRDHHLTRLSGHAIAEFPYVVDARGALAEYPSAAFHTLDNVHFNTLGGFLIGQAIGTYTQGFNTCALDPLTIAQRPQRYCRNPNGGYETTTCTTDAHCNPEEVCIYKPCTTGADCPVEADTCNVL